MRDEAALLTTITTRLCLDELRSARRTRETYVGPWLPEPVGSADLGPLDTAEQRESVSLRAVVLLERLTPAERAVCVLRDAFDHPYAEIPRVLERSEAGCRQLHRRARQRSTDGTARFDVPTDDHLAPTERLFTAAALGDLAGLEAMLAPDVVLVSDGAGWSAPPVDRCWAPATWPASSSASGGGTGVDRAVLAYAEAVSATPPAVTDADASALLEHLDLGQLVELILLLALENARSRFDAALGVASQDFCAVPVRG